MNVDDRPAEFLQPIVAFGIPHLLLVLTVVFTVVFDGYAPIAIAHVALSDSRADVVVTR